MEKLKKTFRIEPLYGLPLLLATAFVFVLKFRILKRIDSDTNLLEIFGYCTQDILVLFFSAYLLQFLKKVGWILFFGVFTLTVLNIFSLSKLGFPLTLSIFSQVSDLIMIQTSVQSPRVYRNVLLITGILGVFSITQLGSHLLKSFLEKIRLSEIAMISMLVILAANVVLPKPKIRKYGKSFVSSLIYKQESLGELLNSATLKKIKTETQYRQPLTPDPVKKYNIVFVVMETLSSKALPLDNLNFMPNFQELEKESWTFKNHYTTWPFSSKSLYSIVCGKINYPSDIIEMRILSRFQCDSWTQPLTRNGVKAGVYYTGDLHYDNMGKFFKSLGFSQLEDKRTLSHLKQYEANSLSIDDQAMVDSFENFLKENPKDPFLKFFITMNSHHPFWTPKGFEKVTTPYLNAIAYQDQILGGILKALRNYNQIDNTIIVVTGDHGKREAAANNEYIPESMFKIPLLIKFPGEGPKSITSPSAHYQIGETISEFLNSKPSFTTGLFQKEALLFFGSDKFYYYLLSKDQHALFDGETLFLDNKWINPESSKSNSQKYLKKFKSYLKGLNETYK